MTKLIITRGLPGSGKSTFARGWVAEDPANRAEVNRDQLRKMLHDGTYIAGRDGTEPAVTAARDAAIETLLRRGVDVVCSDTNLPQKVARGLRNLADATGADFEVQDFTDVPWDVCVERDQARGTEAVGAEVIMGMHSRYLAGASYPLPIPQPAKTDGPVVVPYIVPEDAPPCLIVDIDGTLALMDGRSPFDWRRVDEDLPNHSVIRALYRLVGPFGSGQNCKVFFTSGRDESCRDLTQYWLDQHVILPLGCEPELIMRPAGDTRSDYVVKLELFDKFIREGYDVQLVLDDRDQVVRMWRSLGLACFQVAEGDF